MEEFADAAGVVSLDNVRDVCEQLCNELSIALDFRQSDDQNEIVRWIKEDASEYAALIFNQMGCAERTPIDYPKYCNDLAVLTSLTIPFTEIHMTNVFRDDPGVFKALRGPQGNTAFICGLGIDSYRLAIRAAARRITENSAS